MMVLRILSLTTDSPISGCTCCHCYLWFNVVQRIQKDIQIAKRIFFICLTAFFRDVLLYLNISVLLNLLILKFLKLQFITALLVLCINIKGKVTKEEIISVT